MMSFESAVLAHAFIFDNKYVELLFFALNMSFYGMEMKFKTTGLLVMNVGEISAVEVELILTVVLTVCGYFGQGVLQNSVTE